MEVMGRADRYGLTDPEIAARYAYTREWGLDEPWFSYGKVNKELRDAFDEGRDPERRVWNFTRTLNAALDRMPDWRPKRGARKELWRGVHLEREDLKKCAAHKPGSIHTWAAFSSASTGEGFTAGRNVRFVITSRHGKDINAYSASPNEGEVLLRAGTKMRVTDEPEWRDGMLHVYVEEIDDGEV